MTVNQSPGDIAGQHRLTWWLVRVSLLVSALGLAATLLSYLAYRRRRADLDAASAEAEGERRAKLYRNR